MQRKAKPEFKKLAEKWLASEDRDYVPTTLAFFLEDALTELASGQAAAVPPSAPTYEDAQTFLRAHLFLGDETLIGQDGTDFDVAELLKRFALATRGDSAASEDRPFSEIRAMEEIGRAEAPATPPTARYGNVDCNLRAETRNVFCCTKESPCVDHSETPPQMGEKVGKRKMQKAIDKYYGLWQGAEAHNAELRQQLAAIQGKAHMEDIRRNLAAYESESLARARKRVAELEAELQAAREQLVMAHDDMRELRARAGSTSEGGLDG